MNSIQKLLDSFSGTTPLFPLPEFVFFPKTVQPFYIFEPRYVEMIQDCMAGERLVTVVLLKSAQNGDSDTSLSFARVGTMGYINQIQETEDGKYNILVTGLVKVDVAEVDSDKAYRRGAITILEDFSPVSDAQKKQEKILRLFKSILTKVRVTNNVEALEVADVSLEMLTHIIISSSPIQPVEKQKMLELQSLELRVDILINFMESGLSTLESLSQFNPILPSQPWWN